MRLPSEQHRVLGAFLPTRRNTLSSGDVLLHPRPERRRVEGLRREEAAHNG